MIYVTYDKNTGNLTGAYIQDLLPEHEDCYVEVALEQHDNWTGLKFNLDTQELEVYTPPPAAPVVPVQVTMRQARLALLAHNMLSQIDTAIASLPSPQKEEAQIEWDYSSTVVRDRELVVMIGQALGLSSSDLDALFIEAAEL
jgi:hypothetical protein